MTTHSSPPVDEQSGQRVRLKREQVLVACKICRGRKTKCSGDRPRCRQCEMRNQGCEWETLSDEAPRASKRKYQDLEQRSAAEHELLNHLRELPEPDSLGLIRRLRDGSSTNDLLISARELSSAPHNQISDGALTTIRQRNMTNRPQGTASHVDLDSGSNQVGGEIRPASCPVSRPTLPPISSIWQTHDVPTSPNGQPAPTAPTPSLTPDDEAAGGKDVPRNETVSPQSLYDRWISQT